MRECLILSAGIMVSFWEYKVHLDPNNRQSNEMYKLLAWWKIGAVCKQGLRLVHGWSVACNFDGRVLHKVRNTSIELKMGSTVPNMRIWHGKWMELVEILYTLIEADVLKKINFAKTWRSLLECGE